MIVLQRVVVGFIVWLQNVAFPYRVTISLARIDVEKIAVSWQP